MRYRRHDTALLLVDPYNDWLDERGKVWSRVKDVVETVGTVDNLRQLVAAARTNSLRVFFAPHRRWRERDYDGWQRMARAHIGMNDGRYFEDGTWGGEFHPDLSPVDGDVVCYEHRAENGFADTDLDLQLRQRGVENLIVAGMTAPGCVEGTARSAMERGYSVTLVRDATAAYSMDLMHAAHELTGPLFADAILTTAETVAQLNGDS